MFRFRNDLPLWVEGTQLIEVVTPEMRREHLAAATSGNWQHMLATGPVARA